MSNSDTNENRAKTFSEIVSKVKQNVGVGMEMFYKTYGKFIKSVAMTVCPHPADTNVIINEVLIKFWQNVDKIGEINNPEGWIYVVTMNAARDYLRKEKRHMVCQEDESVIDQNNEIENLISDMTFLDMIKSLSVLEQRIIILKYVSGYTYQEIAEELDMPLSSVTSTFYRSIEKIKKSI